MGDINDSIAEAAKRLPTAVPLQTTEDHLGRILGREPSDEVDSADLTWQQERDRAVDDDDEALLAEEEVENAEDDVIDADNDDGTSEPYLRDTEQEPPAQEGHIVSPADRAIPRP